MNILIDEKKFDTELQKYLDNVTVNGDKLKDIATYEDGKETEDDFAITIQGQIMLLLDKCKTSPSSATNTIPGSEQKQELDKWLLKQIIDAEAEMKKSNPPSVLDYLSGIKTAFNQVRQQLLQPSRQ